jgi:hypothetical protein
MTTHEKLLTMDGEQLRVWWWEMRDETGAESGQALANLRDAIVTAARQSDEAGKREAASRAWDAAREWAFTRPPLGTLFWNESRDRYLDREYPLPPRECVRQCERCGGSEGPMESTRGGPFTHSVIEDCIEHLTSEVKQLKSFAAGVGR